MYQKVSTDLNFVDREKQVEKFWKDQKIFEKSIDSRRKGQPYVFYDGPPTANGKPHIGHVLTRVIKDMIPRYRTMKGYMVPRKAGWDTHGLPVELEVEKMLGLDGKEQIEEYGLEPFIEHCKESVWKYKGMWEDFSSTVGFWADMDNPYVTYHDDYIESEWWALKEIWNKGLLYKGFKIVPYCPRCGTPLSSHEVAQGYKDVKERSAVVRFKAKGEDAYILAWTTTPWTLPSNVALCVNPKETYVKVKAADGFTYYMAEALLDTVLGKLADKENGTPAYEILETYVGTDLEGKEYEPLYQCAADVAEKQHKKGHYVTCADYVTLTDGTGVVHIAPAFGEDEGGGPLGIGEGGQAKEVLGQISDGREAGLQDVAGLASGQEHIGQKGKKQIHTGSRQPGDPLHAVDQGVGVNDAGDHQDPDGDPFGGREPCEPGKHLGHQRRSQGKGRGGPGQKSEQGQKVNTFSRKLIHPVSQDGTAGLRIFLLVAAPYVEHEAEGYGQHQIKAPGDGAPVEDGIGAGPDLHGSHFRDMGIVGVKDPFAEGVKQDVSGQPGGEHHAAPGKI